MKKFSRPSISAPRRRQGPALAFALAILATPAAAEPSSDPEDARGTWSFTLENDIIAGTDRDYTNGALLSYIAPANDLPWVGRFLKSKLFWLEGADDWRMSYGVGQNMYTPQDISRRFPDPDDRPYAGFLYGSVGISADTRASSGAPRQLDVLALDIGIVGPGSLAEPTQKHVHELIDSDDPKGWDEQLATEVAFRLLYERSWRASGKWDLPLLPLEGDVTPHVGLALGTVATYAAAGASFRIGEDLGDDYGPPRVRPALGSPGFFRDIDGFSWYLFAGVQGRAVARDLFIQGNTFKDSPGVNVEPLQLDIQAGFAIQVGRVEMAFTQVLRSPQHTRKGRWNRFGSVNLRTRF